MESLYIWPDNPAASLALIWLVSSIFLWAAREPMLRLLTSLGNDLAEGLENGARRVGAAAEELRDRSRQILLAAGTRDAQGRLDRELERMDAGFSDQLGQYSKLQRRLGRSGAEIGRLHSDSVTHTGAGPNSGPVL